MRCASFAESEGTGVQRGARGQHIINEENAAAGNGGGARNGERLADIAAAVFEAEPGLAGGGADAAQQVRREVESGPLAQGAGDEFALIEAAFEPAVPVQGDRDDDIEVAVAGQGEGEVAAEDWSQRADAVVLIKLDEAAQFVGVAPETVAVVDVHVAPLAGFAEALVVEAGGVGDGGAAAGAEVVGGERLGGVEAAVADGNAVMPSQGLLADAAIVGEEEGEQSGAGPGKPGIRGGFRGAKTREGSPPKQIIPEADG